MLRVSLEERSWRRARRGGLLGRALAHLSTPVSMARLARGKHLPAASAWGARGNSWRDCLLGEGGIWVRGWGGRAAGRRMCRQS